MRAAAEVQEPRRDRRLLLIRVVVVLNVALALNYIGWRYVATINWPNWYIAIPLIVAETYSVIDTCLFSLTMWRRVQRPAPPEAPRGHTVDVLITCYNEPVELVRETVRAASRIDYPHRTYVLDDGASPEMRAMVAEEGADYIIVRSDDWAGHSRYAKAGNLNNALMQTQGEFLLILDADQMPRPEILDHVLGYFADPQMAFVQTPQYFYNVPDNDLLGAQAPLFYGPLQQGKDGWNAAFFCGSNAVLRREALMQLGIRRYVAELEERVPASLATAERLLRRARRELNGLEASARAAAEQSLEALQLIVQAARDSIRQGNAIQAVTWTFQEDVRAVSRGIVVSDLAAIRAELATIPGLEAMDDPSDEFATLLDDPRIADALADRAASPLAAIEAVRALLLTVDLDRQDLAQALMPMATLSVTEDMATAMRLHAMGWKSAFHNELLAYGLAPDDLRSTMQQRLRWAQGTLQVLFRENPLLLRGLSLGQRLMYFATMYSYFSGFAVVVYLVAPMLFLTLGVKPVTVYSVPFFLRLVPFLLVNQLLFQVAGWKVPKWRGQQYSIALFPLWMKAVVGTVRNVYFGRALPFVVTPKTHQAGGLQFRIVFWQFVAMAALVGAGIVGVVRLATGVEDDFGGVGVNLLWVAYDLAALSIVARAMLYRPPLARRPPLGDLATKSGTKAQ